MPSAVIGSLRVNLGIESAEFTAGLKGAQSQLSSLSKSLESFAGKIASVGKTLSAAITIPLLGIGTAAVKAAGDSEKATAAVSAALKSMGEGAGYSLDKLQDMAAGLQKLSTFDDDDIMSKVTANLLTFGKVTGDVFARAQQSALDLSARLGTDLQSSAVMLGKALNDPVKGINALTRVGVSYTEQQKAQIKAMVQSGDLLGAQKVLLTELEKQYAGQAAALAGTSQGQIAQAWNAIGDAMEGVGAIALPFLAQLAQSVKSVAESFSRLSPETQKWVVIGGGIAAAIGPALVALGVMVSSISTLIPLAGALGVAITTALGPVSIAIALVAAGWLLVRDNQTDAQRSADAHQKTLSELSHQIDNVDYSNAEAVASTRKKIQADLDAATTALTRAKAERELAAAIAKDEISPGMSLYPAPEASLADQNAFVNDNPMVKDRQSVIDEVTKQIDELRTKQTLFEDYASGRKKPVRFALINTMTDPAIIAGNAIKASAVEAVDAWDGLREVSAGVREQMAGLAEHARNLSQAWTEFGRGGKDILDGLVAGTMTWKDALSAALDVALDLLKNLMNANNPGGFGTGILGSILNGLTGLGGGPGYGASYFPPAPSLGFASGGTILPGGTGGIDSQLVQFRKSPNERVDITKPGQSLGNSNKVHVTVGVKVDNDGNLQAYVQDISQRNATAAVEQYDRHALPTRVNQINDDPYARG